MNELQELQRELQEAAAAIARAERSVVAHPHVPSTGATLRTIRKRHEKLEGRFLAIANAMGLDVCSYRIELPDSQRATIAGMTSVLSSFQKVFTSVYDSVVNGPKKNAKAGADVIKATALEFAYTFPGSLGIMMTLDNERLLLPETDLDVAMKKTLELITYDNPSQIQRAVVNVGLPAVRLAYQWAYENAKAGYGADIAWQRGGVPKFEVRIQTQEISRLASVIKGATAKEEVALVGDLLRVSLPDRTFQMAVEGKTIQGSFEDAISQSNPVQLPRRYRAVLNVQEKIVSESGEDEITYFLLRLEPDKGENNLLPVASVS